MKKKKSFMRKLFENGMKMIGVTTGLVAILTVIDLLISFPLMWAWNYVMPYLFGLPEINYWRSFCLLFVLVVLWKINVTTIEVEK